VRLVPGHQKHPQDKKLFDLWMFFHIKNQYSFGDPSNFDTFIGSKLYLSATWF
jgi:hypothetical protein